MAFSQTSLISDSSVGIPKPHPCGEVSEALTNRYPDGIPNSKRSLLVYHSSKHAVPSIHNHKKCPIWSPKQRRAYQRIMSGFKFAQFLHCRLRFMTLTTSNEGRDNDIQRDLIVLVKRIRRHYGRFDYVRVKTDEGNGVLHLIYRGSYIPQKWLSQQWVDIHKSWNVDIRDTQRYHCSYVINQYLAGQSQFVRYSMTMKWVFRGFVSYWYQVKRQFGCVEGLDVWNKILHRYAVSQMQKTLSDFG